MAGHWRENSVRLQAVFLGSSAVSTLSFSNTVTAPLKYCLTGMLSLAAGNLVSTFLSGHWSVDPIDHVSG